jgi:hypothetical protein
VSDHLKLFERIAYGSLAVGLLSTLVDKKSIGDVTFVAFDVAFTAVLALLVWAAARRAHRWAAWVFFVVAGLRILATVGEFWVGGPAWMQEFLKPEAPPTIIELALDVAASLLFVAAFYFYATRRSVEKSDSVGGA